MPFDFPNAPTEGQTVSGPNGATYAYLGGRWMTIVPPPPLSGPTVNWAVQMMCVPDLSPTVSEVEMMIGTGQPNLCTGGQGYANRTTANPTATFVADNTVFDGNMATNRIGQGFYSDETSFAYQMAAAQTVRRVGIGCNVLNETPTGLLVKASYDGRATWKAKGMAAIPLLAANAKHYFDINPDTWVDGTGRTSMRACRIVINAWQGFASPMVCAMILAATISGATLCTGGVPLTSGCGVASDNPAAYAFDGDSATQWQGFGTGVAGQRLGYAFPNLINPAELRMQAPNWSGGAQQMPTNFDFQYSVDLQNWITLMSVSGLTWSASETKAWTLPA